jgi:hypothetical protein
MRRPTCHFCGNHSVWHFDNTERVECWTCGAIGPPELVEDALSPPPTEPAK